MAVTVRVGTVLSKLLGGKSEASAEGATIGEVISSLGIKERLCDDSGNLRRHFNVHVNEGEDVRLLEGLETPVKDGDTVTVLSAVAGGGGISRKIWLTFPDDLIERPLIWEVARKFEVVTNIRQASISKTVGIVGLELSGALDQVEGAIEFFIESGLSVEPVELDIIE